jgi:Family of unknown function (DUF5694)
LLAAFALTSATQHVAHAAAPSAKHTQSPPPIKVMILGTYHMASPGLDVVNMQVDDVTQPKRQKELAALVEQLTKFAPTKVAVEVTARTDDFVYPAYRTFTPADLLKDKNEITQIGFRLAHRMKHENVYAIDEQSDTIDYFPFGKLQTYAKETGGEAALAAVTERWQVIGKSMEALQKRGTISQILRKMNEPRDIDEGQRAYVSAMHIGAGDRWLGADLNAAWYLRNAKIHAKLMKIAKPGDRIVVVYGAGHNYWLRELVRTTPGYELVEPRAFLK